MSENFDKAVEVARFFSRTRHLPFRFHSRGDRGQTVNRRSKSAACDVVVGSSERTMEAIISSNFYADASGDAGKGGDAIAF